MATITLLNLCEVCDNELGTPVPEECPRCRARLKAHKSRFFESPDYASFQFREAIFKTLENAETTEGISRERAAEQAEIDITEEYRKWAVSCPDGDRVAAARDTLHFLQHITHSGMKGESLGTFIKTCKAVGELAELTEKYLKLGGYTHGRTVAEAIRRSRLGAPPEIDREGD